MWHTYLISYNYSVLRWYRSDVRVAFFRSTHRERFTIQVRFFDLTLMSFEFAESECWSTLSLMDSTVDLLYSRRHTEHTVDESWLTSHASCDGARRGRGREQSEIRNNERKSDHLPPFLAAGLPLHLSFAWKPQYWLRSIISISLRSPSSSSKPMPATTFSCFATAAR